jgi:hypothetical protein
VSALAAPAFEADVAACGYAVLPGLIEPATCAALAAGYDDDASYRKTIVMERHGYGRGAYRYFRYPLPPVVTELRASLYARLVPTANAWNERLGRAERFPATLDAMLARCAAAGQTRPTPLVLRYATGDYNALHQDTYGAIAFPLQATILLSDPRGGFTGGEFLLLEGRPRRQSVAHVVPLALGDAVVFANREKPNPRGGRSTFRHGVGAVRSGVRLTLGLIFHDAE